MHRDNTFMPVYESNSVCSETVSTGPVGHGVKKYCIMRVKGQFLLERKLPHIREIAQSRLQGMFLKTANLLIEKKNRGGPL